MNINKKGFTLTELMAVVIIIGVLSGIGLGTYKKSVERSYFSEGQASGASIAEAVIRYTQENGAYKPNFDELDISLANSAVNAKDRYKISSNNFCYTISTISATSNISVTAARTNEGNCSGTAKYSLVYEIKGVNYSEYCTGNSDFCFSMGYKNNCTSNSSQCKKG